jgi:Porin subfamily
MMAALIGTSPEESSEVQMKTVRSLLLGSVAALIAVAGAQAADMPVKAPPVKYVTLCNLYGEGFYQIPGQDTCISIGATIRLDGGVGADGNGGPFISGAYGRDGRSDILGHARGTAWIDAREKTGWGELRGYASAAADVQGIAASGEGTAPGSVYLKRAFVQFAGFVIGKTQSFFDFHNGEFSYGSYHFGGGSNTYDSGTILAAYSAKFAIPEGTATASIAAEDSRVRRTALWDAGSNGLTIGGFPGPVQLSGPFEGLYPHCDPVADVRDTFSGCATGDYAAERMPDIVGSFRIEHPWGSAQIAAAVHQVNANAYGSNLPGPLIGPGAFTGVATASVIGSALMGGFEFNVPTGAGDKVWAEGAYTKGAIAYTGLSQPGSFTTFDRFKGGTVGVGWALDGIFANQVGPASAGAPIFSGMQLTTAWSVGAAYEHNWLPNVRTSVFGVVTDVIYDQQAQTIFCESPVGPVRTVAGAAPNFLTGPVIGCNPNCGVRAVGSRTVWNPVKNMDVGFEVTYSKLDQQMNPNFVTFRFNGGGNQAAGLYAPAGESIWSGLLRFQYHFGAPSPEESRS